MLKNLKIISLLGISLFLITGCGEVAKLANGEEAVVTLKDGEMISVDSLYNELKMSYALQSLITMMDKQIFETEFEENIEDAKAYAEQAVQSMLATYGGEEELLNLISSQGFSNLEDYTEYIYLGNMQQYALEQYSKDQITDDQVEKFYEEEAEGDIEIAHILIVPDATSSSTEEEITKAEQDAEDLIMDTIIPALKAAGDDEEEIKKVFEELVEKYSDDSATLTNGGSLGTINNYGALDISYDELVNAAYDLKDGEYTTKIVVTEFGYHVILRTSSEDKGSLEDLTDDIRAFLANNLVISDSNQMTFDMLLYYRDLYEMEITDSELKNQYDDYVKEAKKSLAEN